ncbi:MAG: hypothetical protein WC683_01560 [bacterium]
MTYYPEADPVYKSTKTVAVGDAIGGALIYECFDIVGSVEIVGLWGVFTNTSQVVTVSGCGWDIGGLGGTADLTDTAVGTDCSGVLAGSILAKTDLTGVAASLADKAGYDVIDVTVPASVLCPVLASPKKEASATIGFHVTVDADTDCEIEFFCLWKKRSSDASVTPGSGNTRGGV